MIRSRKRLIACLPRPFVAAGGGGGVAFDAVSEGIANGASSASWTHTPVGTPTGVAVLVGRFFDTDQITAITYGGNAMTLEEPSGDPDIGPWIYSLGNPPSGAQTVSITWAGSVFALACAITVTGGDTSNVISNTATATGTSTTPSVTCTSATGELVVDVVHASVSSTPTPGAGQTIRSDQEIGGGFQVFMSSEAGAASVTMSHTVSSNTWVQCAASFKAA
jgi:hypothetical protein